MWRRRKVNARSSEKTKDNATMDARTKICASASCPNKASTLVNGEKLKACSACLDAAYCSKECQKNAWVKEGHKHCCAKRDVPRRSVEGDGNCLEDVQAAIDGAESGDVVALSEGSYRWKKMKGSGGGGENALRISKPVRLWGPHVGGRESVTLHCNLTIDDAVSSDGSVTVANLTVMGSLTVQSNSYESITFSGARAHQSDPKGDGAMVHIMRGGKCLFFLCELIGGDEALYIDGIDDLSHSREDNANKVHIKRTTVRNGAKRGICADDKFILEKSVIRDNGWYGIRSNLGWTDKGGNDWQRNPAKPNQSATGGNGMFDGIRIPMNGGSFSRTGDTLFPGFGQL